MEGLEENGSVQVGELLPCKICGRTFFPVALKKHGPICQKTATKKRKTFDSSRQRAEGTDIPTVKPLKPRPEPPKKPSNWRRKHEEFIATIRAAKGLGQVLKEGGKLPPPPPPSYDPDYIQCPYCQRRFNENAADRHINFCKEQAARISNKGKFSTDTKGKSTSRTQYKPPALKKFNSPGTTSSGSSRLPQPSGTSKTVVGAPSGKVSSVSSSSGNKLQTLSPSHKGIPAPHVGTNIKPRNSTPPSLARNPASGVLTSKRKTYSDSYMARLRFYACFEFATMDRRLPVVYNRRDPSKTPGKEGWRINKRCMWIRTGTSLGPEEAVRVGTSARLYASVTHLSIL
ncbi:zinc finger C2HC domain-containing protein 1A isoform X1 [Bos taurus]|uniref:zinc finger C2HC domain-containing protein 1A isoform X1 n=1 Tax=Bos taurus TaxID=9913 RepID=UPI0028CBA0F5|nr:zinc finger C2HC domain-containing protein 1A isoform X1 [Bos taurus]